LGSKAAFIHQNAWRHFDNPAPALATDSEYLNFQTRPLDVLPLIGKAAQGARSGDTLIYLIQMQWHLNLVLATLFVSKLHMDNPAIKISPTKGVRIFGFSLSCSG
jgi:hypothetical protein